MRRIIKNKGARTGIFFGATSGVITTIGLIVGLHAGTQSLVAVLGGILVVAIADAMSDAMGIHLAQEADPDSTDDHIWAATIWTFLTKLIVALTFALPAPVAAATDCGNRLRKLGPVGYHGPERLPRARARHPSADGHHRAPRHCNYCGYGVVFHRRLGQDFLRLNQSGGHACR